MVSKVIDLGISRGHLYSPRKLKVSSFAPNGSEQPDRPGTGFIVQTDKTAYLVTNRHVVDPSYDDPDRVGSTVFLVDIREGNGSVRPSGLRIEDPQFTFADDRDDVAILDIVGAQRYGPSTGQVPGIYSMDMLAIEEDFTSDDRSSAILPMDVVAAFGFPELGGVQMERPLVLSGFVASDPAHRPEPMPELSGGGVVQSKNVVFYQGFSRGGASGSPVLAVQRGLPFGPEFAGAPPSRGVRLIGINAGRIGGSPSHPSALSYLVRSDSIIRTIREAQAAAMP